MLNRSLGIFSYFCAKTPAFGNTRPLGYNEELDKLVAVECAKISVNEILLINHNVKCDAGERLVNAMVDYYEDVKNELENY